MVRLILGRSGSGKTTRILSEIAQNAKNACSGQILLVPEQFSLSSERELCETAGNGISRFAEVMTFKSLARRVFCEAGGLSLTPLDTGGRLLAMYMAVSRMKAGEHLRVYNNVTSRPELMKRLVETVSEFKLYGIKPEDLFCEGMGGLLPEKLCDLSYIYGAYDAVMTGDLKDPSDVLEMLAEKLGDGGYFNGRRVYVDGFNGFTPVEMKILSIIASGASELTFCLCCEGDNDDGGVFSHTLNTLRDIIKMCRRVGSPYMTEHDDTSSKRYKNSASDLARLEKCLFDYNAKSFLDEPDGSVRVCAAPTVYEECEIAASGIIGLMQEGLRCREIAVTVRDLESYAPHISAAFAKYGIPMFLDRKDAISGKTPVIAVCAALDACLNGFRCDDVIRLAKTGLAGVNFEEAARLENYALTWSINGQAWEREFCAHPDGFCATADEGSRAILATLNGIRSRLISPLKKLRESLKDERAVRLCEAVFLYLDAVGMRETLNKRAGALETAGKARQALEYNQLWDIICRALDQCVLILGDEKIPFSEFAPLLKLVLCSYDVGSIPTTLDCVTVGEAGRMRFSRPRALFVLGVSDGVFPARPSESGVLTSSEKKRMHEDAGLCLSPSDEEQMLREQQNVYQTLSAPSEKLIISYPKTGADGEAAAQSYIITRLLKLFACIKTEYINENEYKTYAQAPCIELACEFINEGSGAKKDAALAAAFRAVSDTRRGRELIDGARRANTGTRGPLEKKDVIAGLYGQKVSVTASRVEKFSSCRFAFFSEYGLRAKIRRKAELEASLAGSFIHYVLEKTAADVAALPSENPWRSITKEKIKGIASKHIEEYVDSALGGLSDKTPRFVYLFKRLETQVFLMIEGMVDELSVSLFRPVSFEKDLSEDGAAFFEYDGEKIPLYGRIDRVDMWENNGKKYVRVIDYKTGAKKFNYTDVEYGLGIQLLLYLFALAAGDGSIVPAGVFYTPALQKTIRVECGKTREKILGEVAKASRRSGVMLDDVGVILAMENIPEGSGARFLPVTLYGRGDERHTKKTGYVITAEEFEIFRKHVGRLLKGMAREVENGSIECDPFAQKQKSSCDYCEYLPVCQFDVNQKTDRFRQFESIGKKKFFALKREGD